MKKFVLILALGVFVVASAILFRYTFGNQAADLPTEGTWHGQLGTTQALISLKLQKTEDGKYLSAVYQMGQKIESIKEMTVNQKGVSFVAIFPYLGQHKCQLQWKDKSFKSLAGKCRSEKGEEELLEMNKSSAKPTDDK